MNLWKNYKLPGKHTGKYPLKLIAKGLINEGIKWSNLINLNNLKFDLVMDWFNQSIRKSKVKLNPFGFRELIDLINRDWLRELIWSPKSIDKPIESINQNY